MLRTRRRAERIDRLRVVADHGQTLAARPQRQQDRGLQPVGVLIFVDQHVIEPLGDFRRDRGLLHHVRPVEQQIVVIEHVLALLRFDIVLEQNLQLVLPRRAPRKVRAQNILERQFAVDRARIDREARALGGKALLGLRKAEIVAHQIHQIGGILAVVDGEGRREPDRLGIFAQQPRADGVERAGPAHGVGRGGALRRHEGGDDPLDPPRHLRRRAARERQQHDAARIGALRDQPRHPMRQASRSCPSPRRR